MKKICIIGHFGKKERYADGQTIKTQILSETLKKRFGNYAITRVDTYHGLLSRFMLPFKIVYNYFFSRNIIMMPAENGLRIITPIIVYLNRIAKRNLIYVVVGGWLPELLEKNANLLKRLTEFDFIFVETRGMKNKLAQLGINNVMIMPNYKELEIVDICEIEETKSEPYKLCTFSRVMKEKGIEDAINAVIRVNEKYNRIMYTLDIYGQIQSGQEVWFEKVMKKKPDYIRYCGIVPYNSTTKTLCQYFALLFPTYYEGEGFPGTIIDSFAAALPVIATNWKYNAEIVDNQKTGFIYDRSIGLESILDNIRYEVDQWMKLRENCREAAYQYLPDNVIKTLIENIV